VSAWDSLVRAAARLYPLDAPAFLGPLLHRSLERSSLRVPPQTFSRFAGCLLFYPIPIEVCSAHFLPSVAFAFLLVSCASVQAIPFLLPAQLAARRRRSAEAELPFATLLFFILSHDAFPSLPAAFTKVAELRRVFPGLAAEAETLARNLAYSNSPETQVVEATFSSHPSRNLREFIHGYVAALESGRDVRDFVEEEAKRLLSVYEEGWKSFAGMISSMTEVSFIFLALFPVGVQMITGALLSGGSGWIVGALTVALLPVAALMILWIDRAEPLLHDWTYPAKNFAATLAAFCAGILGYTFGLIPAWGTASLLLAAASIFVFFSRRFFAQLRAGEREVPSMLHDLAEDTRAGVSLPDALGRLRDATSPASSLGSPLRAFAMLLSLGRPPVEAQRPTPHPSWLVRVSFALLSCAFEVGAGYEQLEKLSTSFRRVSDAKNSIRTSVLPFAVLGVTVPVISIASFWFLRNLQGLAAASGFAIQAEPGFVVASVLATSVLTGLLVSKAYSASVRCMWGVPPTVCAALAAILLFGVA
jgi:hypothetical protein